MKFTLDDVRGHELAPDEILNKMPALGATSKLPEEDTWIRLKLFSPFADWTWYAIEYDPQMHICFGLVKGFETELGDFSLDELGNMHRNGLPLIERDCYFEPVTLDQIVHKLAI